MFLDLDNFKTLNDTHGHAAGDLLLIEVSNRLRASVRDMDTVARIGGDEFVVMFREFDGERGASQAQAGAIAEKIRLCLSEPYLLQTQDQQGAQVTVEHRCTASIGIVLFLGEGASQDDIFKYADAAMYQAKAAGRNTIRFHEGTIA
jgi:diguanylate cyclase (GGDEF)-like protein